MNDKIKIFTSDGNTSTMHRQPNLESFVNGAVCGKCNSGWMSTLETQAGAIFQKLTTGTDIRALSPNEVDIIARWTAKTAIVLGYVTPIPAVVPEFIRRSLLPSNSVPPQMRVFYAFIQADRTLEGGYLQLRYGSEIPVIGTEGGSGYRFTICVFNHCLTVDFPPILHGVWYDLKESCSAQIWPLFVPAGTSELSLTAPVLIGDALHAICSRIKVGFDVDAIHV